MSWICSVGPQAQVGSLPGIDTSRPIEPQLAGAVRTVLSETGLEPSIVTGGVSGLDRPDARGVADLLTDTCVTEVALAHDSTTAYLGALGDHRGCVVACGTGVVTLAVGEHDVARVDGWGYIMGDAGSAYWIGRNALEAAMRGYDGRRQMTALTDEIAADFDDLELAYLELQADPARVSRVAKYATLVDELAPTDPVAANILDKAAAHLSEAVQAALRRVGLMGSEAPKVCAIGQVFQSERLLHRFTGFLTLQWPNFALTEPAGHGIDGAVALVELDPASPMSSRVVRASR